MSRYYLVRLSPVSLLISGLFLCLFSIGMLLALLTGLLGILQIPPFSFGQEDVPYAILSLIGFPICGYLGIGAVLNASRAIRAWFRAHFGWR